MQLHELRSLLYRLLDEDGVRRPNSVLDATLNDGYRMAALISQACEITTSFNYNASQHFCPLPTDFFVPLRVTLDGTRLYPVRQGDLDLLDEGWLSAAVGDALYYFTVGALTPTPQLWAYPRPAATSRVQLTYAAMPKRLQMEGDIPRFPANHHYCIVLWGYAWELMKERGALFANKAYRVFMQFVQDVNELQKFIYRRTPDRDWQMHPWEAEAVRKKLMSLEQALTPQQQQSVEMRDLGI